jgi:hypothetical protein
MNFDNVYCVSEQLYTFEFSSPQIISFISRSRDMSLVEHLLNHARCFHTFVCLVCFFFAKFRSQRYLLPISRVPSKIKKTSYLKYDNKGHPKTSEDENNNRNYHSLLGVDNI